jgi:hypothetical protein
MDGDMDYVVGNLGLNYKYKASETEPFQVYADDFDNSGTIDIVLAYYNSGNVFPLRGRQCSSEQIPSLKEKFPTYSIFASSTLSEIYGDKELAQAHHLQAFTFASTYIENLGEGRFNVHQLPLPAQFSSVNGIVVGDFNDDGSKDLLLAGNMYSSEVETARNDAGLGLVLTGNGTNDFTPLPSVSSGFLAPGNVKGLAKLKRDDGSTLILVANNNNRLQAFAYSIEDEPATKHNTGQ